MSEEEGAFLHLPSLLSTSPVYSLPDCPAPSVLFRAVCVVRGPDGRLRVGSSEEGPDPSKGPSWASAEASEDPGLEGGDVAKFKLLYAGTADKAMMLELEADEEGCFPKPSDRTACGQDLIPLCLIDSGVGKRAYGGHDACPGPCCFPCEDSEGAGGRERASRSEGAGVGINSRGGSTCTGQAHVPE